MRTILDEDGIRHQVPKPARFDSASWTSTNCGKIVSKTHGRNIEEGEATVTCIPCASGKVEDAGIDLLRKVSLFGRD